MNLIPKVAEMLGVEIGEEFKMKAVGDCDTSLAHFLYRFTETEFQFKNNGYWVKTHIPTSLFMGLVEVEKLPFEPKEGERYWYVFFKKDFISTNDTMFLFYHEHYCRKYCGNCFRTKAEAEKHKYEIYEKLTGKKWEGK